MNLADAIFANLDGCMRKEGLSKKRLALLLGVHYSTVLRWWKRKDMPVISFLSVLAKLGLDAEFILTPRPVTR